MPTAIFGRWHAFFFWLICAAMDIGTYSPSITTDIATVLLMDVVISLEPVSQVIPPMAFLSPDISMAEHPLYNQMLYWEPDPPLAASAEYVTMASAASGGTDMVIPDEKFERPSVFKTRYDPEAPPIVTGIRASIFLKRNDIQQSFLEWLRKL